jgi:hypothetical protein
LFFKYFENFLHTKLQQEKESLMIKNFRTQSKWKQKTQNKDIEIFFPLRLLFLSFQKRNQRIEILKREKDKRKKKKKREREVKKEDFFFVLNFAELGTKKQFDLK